MIGNILDAFVHPFEMDMISDELEKLKNEINNMNSSKSKSITLRFRMKTRTQPKTEYPNYQFVQMSGYMVDLKYEASLERSSPNSVFNRQKSHPYLRSSSKPNFNNSKKIITQSNSTTVNLIQPNSFNHHLSSCNNQNLKYLFIGFIQTIQRESFEQLTLFESFQDEYMALFSLNCQLIAVDHRISNLTGYLPKEIINSYLNQYIHSNDQLISKIAHQMSKFHNLIYLIDTCFLCFIKLNLTLLLCIKISKKMNLIFFYFFLKASKYHIANESCILFLSLLV